MSTPTGGLVQGLGHDIVGRRQELDQLRAWLDLARQGAGRLILCGGEPGIGKTRLAQEFAGFALAAGTNVAWGRCVEAEGAPAFWPWRQVLRSLSVDADSVLAGGVESPEDRFRVLDDVTQIVRGAADSSGLAIVLDDVHWADEASLLVLRHLADQIVDARLLVLAALRHAAPASALTRLLPELLRSPGVQRFELQRFSLTEVHEQLSRLAGADLATDARAVLDVTGGNPLFVREVAGAMADGTWRSDRPPSTVLDVVDARLHRVSPSCRRFVQAAAIVGLDFSVALVAAVLDEPVAPCLPLVDEAIAHGLVDPVAAVGQYRFVHALTRDAVEASLTTTDRAALHRAVAEAIAEQFAVDLSEHLAEIARHWLQLAPYGEAATARAWAIRAADDATRRLAYEEGVRLYRAALALDPTSITDVERSRVLAALGRAANFAGDLKGCVEAAVSAAEAARAAGDPELMADAALVIEATPDVTGNAVAKRLCEDALVRLGGTAPAGMRARLLAQRSHLAFYDGEQDHVEALSATALNLARASADDGALVAALHARKEACPGPNGRPERVLLADEMLALAQRTDSARTAMWGELWRIDTMVERGAFPAATEELAALRAAVDRVGGPVSAWHLDRVSACIAQARGRYDEAVTAGRRAFERMHAVEPRPATGAYFSLLCALSGHVGASEEATEFVLHPFDPLPRFRTIGPLSRAFLLLRAGRPEEAAASFQQAGPIDAWSLPAFFVLPGYVYGVLVSAEVGRTDDLRLLLDRLQPFGGEHASGEGVLYLGPVELTLGRGAAALGHLDVAIDHLEAAAGQAGRAGAPGFVAEARYHLALALRARNRSGDRQRAELVAHDADRLARTLGMTAYVERTGALVAQLGGGRPAALSRREDEVATLVADGLTNRQIAARLFISERTAENHVQHILTKLGFTRRSQIAAWTVRTQMSRPMSGFPDVPVAKDS